MNSEEYYKYDAVNSGSLATFDIWDRNIRDEPEEKYEFQLGKCFEGYIRQKYDKGYILPYFPLKNMNKRIIKAIIEGQDLNTIVRVNKNKSIHKSDLDIQEQLEIIRKEKGFPIDEDDFELIKSTADNLLRMSVLDGITVSEFLEHAEFDVPIVWEDEYGYENKALFDVVSTLPDGTGTDISVVLDEKYYASPYVFRTMFSNKLWVQERHYTEALKHYCAEKGTEPYHKMPFIVGYKDSGLTQANFLDEEFIERAIFKYTNLKERYISWLNDGKKETGHLQERHLRVY